MPRVVGARFGVGPLPSFAGFLALKKPRMTRHMARNSIHTQMLSILPVRFAKLLRDKSMKTYMGG